MEGQSSMRYGMIDRRAWFTRVLRGGVSVAAVLTSSRLASAVCNVARQAQAAALSQELFKGQVFPCSKDWLEYCECHCTADRLHAGVDFETPDGQPVHAVSGGVALNVKIGLGAVTVLTDDPSTGVAVIEESQSYTSISRTSRSKLGNVWSRVRIWGTS